MSIYLRPRGEKAKAYAFQREHTECGDDEARYCSPSINYIDEKLFHGDILYNVSAFRGMDTWSVIGYSDGDVGLECLYEDPGYATVNAKISCQIEDPVDFYADVTDECVSGGINTIHFDGCYHADIIQVLCSDQGAVASSKSTLSWSTHGGYDLEC
jgi:hypothetical protein